MVCGQMGPIFTNLQIGLLDTAGIMRLVNIKSGVTFNNALMILAQMMVQLLILNNALMSEPIHTMRMQPSFGRRLICSMDLVITLKAPEHASHLKKGDLLTLTLTISNPIIA